MNRRAWASGWARGYNWYVDFRRHRAEMKAMFDRGMMTERQLREASR